MKQQLVRCQAIAIYFSAYKLLDSTPPAQLTRLHLTVSVRPITVISLNYFHIFSQLYVILKSMKKSEQLLIVSFHDLFDFICSRKCILEKSILEMSKQIADDVAYRDRMHALFRKHLKWQWCWFIFWPVYNRGCSCSLFVCRCLISFSFLHAI